MTTSRAAQLARGIYPGTKIRASPSINHIGRALNICRSEPAASSSFASNSATKCPP